MLNGASSSAGGFLSGLGQGHEASELAGGLPGDLVDELGFDVGVPKTVFAKAILEREAELICV
jgi:hypothetical protein